MVQVSLLGCDVVGYQHFRVKMEAARHSKPTISILQHHYKTVTWVFVAVKASNLAIDVLW